MHMGLVEKIEDKTKRTYERVAGADADVDDEDEEAVGAADWSERDAGEKEAIAEFKL